MRMSTMAAKEDASPVDQIVQLNREGRIFPATYLHYSGISFTAKVTATKTKTFLLCQTKPKGVTSQMNSKLSMNSY